jgi:hypothetical protein
VDRRLAIEHMPEKLEAAAEFYSSVAAGFAHVLFFPPMVALILSLGF